MTMTTENTFIISYNSGEDSVHVCNCKKPAKSAKYTTKAYLLFACVVMVIFFQLLSRAHAGWLDTWLVIFLGVLFEWDIFMF